MKNLLYILLLGFISCESTTTRDNAIINETQQIKIVKATKQDLINFANDAIEGELSDSAMIIKYYTRPTHNIIDSITFTELSQSFEYIKRMRATFPEDSLIILWGDEMSDSPYLLYHPDYSKDDFCDNCGLIILKENVEHNLILCYKDEGIFSSRPRIDWESWEVNWR